MPAAKSAGKAAEPGAAVGSIEPHVLYPLPEFQRRTGWGRHAMRAARRNGLTVRYAANRGYVHGKDFIAYVLREPADADAAVAA